MRFAHLALALFAAVAFAQTSRAEDAPSKTLDNLQAAFNGESNANAKYTAFATKADAEGYHQVASLFRAAAAAEKIHFTNHAVVIKAMGAEPKADIKPVEVKSTRENIEAAMAGESYERDTMYPEFVKVAEAEKNSKALRSFKIAMAVEGHHAILYKTALDNLESWREGTHTYYICAECGETLYDPPPARCGVCGASKEKFNAVS
jgi:rubrerythrin